MITTDNKWKDFKYRDDVPVRVLVEDFDWTDAEDGYFKYKGTWYHLSQFERGGEPGWDGSLAESMTTGVLIMLSPDREKYKVASWRASG